LTSHPYPYVWVHDYDVIDSDYEHLKEALKEHNYWERYYQPGRLKILRVPGGYEYAFEDRPVFHILDGKIYVKRDEYTEKPHICEHHAALTVSILKTLGLVRGYRKKRRPMTEEELADLRG